MGVLFYFLPFAHILVINVVFDFFGEIDNLFCEERKKFCNVDDMTATVCFECCGCCKC